MSSNYEVFRMVDDSIYFSGWVGDAGAVIEFLPIARNTGNPSIYRNATINNFPLSIHVAHGMCAPYPMPRTDVIIQSVLDPVTDDTDAYKYLGAIALAEYNKLAAGKEEDNVE